MQMTTRTQTHKPVTPTTMPIITGSRIGVVTVPLKDSIVVSVAGGDGGGSTSAGDSTAGGGGDGEAAASGATIASTSTTRPPACSAASVVVAFEKVAPSDSCAAAASATSVPAGRTTRYDTTTEPPSHVTVTSASIPPPSAKRITAATASLNVASHTTSTSPAMVKEPARTVGVASIGGADGGGRGGPTAHELPVPTASAFTSIAPAMASARALFASSLPPSALAIASEPSNPTAPSMVTSVKVWYFEGTAESSDAGATTADIVAATADSSMASGGASTDPSRQTSNEIVSDAEE